MGSANSIEKPVAGFVFWCYKSFWEMHDPSNALWQLLLLWIRSRWQPNFFFMVVTVSPHFNSTSYFMEFLSSTIWWSNPLSTWSGWFVVEAISFASLLLHVSNAPILSEDSCWKISELKFKEFFQVEIITDFVISKTLWNKSGGTILEFSLVS